MFCCLYVYISFVVCMKKAISKCARLVFFQFDSTAIVWVCLRILVDAELEETECKLSYYVHHWCFWLNFHSTYHMLVEHRWNTWAKLASNYYIYVMVQQSLDHYGASSVSLWSGWILHYLYIFNFVVLYIHKCESVCSAKNIRYNVF